MVVKKPCTAYVLVILSITLVRQALGYCGNAQPTILDPIPVAPHSRGAVQSAVLRAMWKAYDPMASLNLRHVPLKGLLGKEQLDALFAPGTKMIGPAYHILIDIYGRDLSLPMSPAVPATFADIARYIEERLSGKVVTRTWTTTPVPANQRQVHAGLEELRASLPGLPSPSCPPLFREEDYHRQHICLEVWWTRHSQGAIEEYLGANFRQAVRSWYHTYMSELGFPQTFLLWGRHDYLPAVMRFLKPHHFTPSLSFRFTLLMQGGCWFPFTPQKQTALEAVLIPLLEAAGSIFMFTIQEVAYAPPITWHDANGSASSYFFVNVTFLCGKYEGPKYKKLSQLFGEEGPFVGRGGEPSHLQQGLLRVGLPVSALRATPPQLLRGNPPVTPRDMVQKMIEEQESWKRGLLLASLTGAALLLSALFLGGGGWGGKACRGEAPADAGGNAVEPAALLTTESDEGLAGSEAIPLLRTLSQEAVEVHDPDPLPECNAHQEVASLSKVEDSLITGREESVLLLESAASMLAGISRGNSNLRCASRRRVTDDTADEHATQRLASSLVDVPGIQPLWNADFIPPHAISIARRPDGTPLVLGNGTFGQVVMGILDGVHEVALKISKSLACKDAIMNEMSLLKSCQSSNIVQFLGVSYKKNGVWLVMEYMPGGDLRSFLNRQQIWRWSPMAAELALDIARGLAYLHSQRVMHLDLKSGNVLLTSGGKAKIADVGMARLMAESQTHGSNLGCTTMLLDKERTMSKASNWSYWSRMWERLHIWPRKLFCTARATAVRTSIPLASFCGSWLQAKYPCRACCAG
eukprot:jgi/Botrbrau1/13942/Bobra.0193s0008.2